MLHSGLDKLSALNEFICKVTRNLAGLTLIMMVLIVMLQIVCRYILNDSPAWTEEVARYIQVWIILFGSPVCIQKSSHLSIDYLKDSISLGVRKLLQFISYVMISLFSVSIIVFGIQFILKVGYQNTPATQIPLGFIYMAFPIAGTLMLIESLIIINKTFSKH